MRNCAHNDKMQCAPYVYTKTGGDSISKARHRGRFYTGRSPCLLQSSRLEDHRPRGSSSSCCGNSCPSSCVHVDRALGEIDRRLHQRAPLDFPRLVRELAREDDVGDLKHQLARSIDVLLPCSEMLQGILEDDAFEGVGLEVSVRGVHHAVQLRELLARHLRQKIRTRPLPDRIQVHDDRWVRQRDASTLLTDARRERIDDLVLAGLVLLLRLRRGCPFAAAREK
mmetsp:Transcript_2484/g.5889  ORF Transcript_2484/g.5889 Transcript_2484/m.5889 type:complete len:225 (-) Transcript_2484:127-801(-)